MTNLEAYALGVFSGGIVTALALAIIARRLMVIGQEWMERKGLTP